MKTTCEPMDRLKTTIRVRCPGTTDGMIDLEVVNTVDSFFRRTNAWRWAVSFDLQEGETDYGIAPPENSVLVRVMRMVIAGQPVLPVTDSSGAAGSQLGRGRITEDRHYDPTVGSIYEPDRVINQAQAGPTPLLRYAIFFPQYLSITLPPDSEMAKYPMDGEIALTINPGHCCDDCSLIDLPEWMYDHFFEAWLHGVQASLMSQISKPYSNAVMAEYHGRKFRMLCGFHKQEADRGRFYDTPRWRYPRQGGWIK